MTQVKRAYAYIRVSTDKQVENYSLDSQEKSIRDFCKRNEIELVEIFREEGESAKTANRTELTALRARCRTAKRDNIQHVIIFKSDRLARNIKDFLMIVEELSNSGVTLLSPNEAFDLSAVGKLNTNVVAVFAQFDNDLRSERTITGMKEALSRGRWVWQPVLGFNKGTSQDGPSLTQDETIAPIILQGFKKVALGEPKEAVLKELNVLGLRTRSGKSVSKQTFNSILKNPLYVGRVVSEKFGIDCVGDFEPIVTLEIFKAVQDRRKKPSGKQGRKLENPEFPFRRWLQCGNCMTPLTGSTSKGNGGSYGYYHCWNKKCKEVSVKKEVVETLFIEFLQREIVSPEILELFEAVVRDMWAERNKESIALVASIDQKIQHLESNQEKLLDLYISGKGISEETYTVRNEKMTGEIASLRKFKDDSLSLEIEIEPIINFAKSMLQDLTGCWNRTEPHTRPRFLRAMLPNGATFKDGSLRTTQSTWFITAFSTSTTTDDALAAPSVLSWNQLVSWLMEMDQLRMWLGETVKTA